jgi:hypothetical protein
VCCEIRKTNFQLDANAIPHAHSLDERTCDQRSADHTVIGKAFWGVAHARKDQSNRRKRLPQYAVWEIHPVMALYVIQ